VYMSMCANVCVCVCVSGSSSVVESDHLHLEALRSRLGSIWGRGLVEQMGKQSKFQPQSLKEETARTHKYTHTHMYIHTSFHFHLPVLF